MGAPERKDVDGSETKAVVTLVGSTGNSLVTDPRFAAWVDAAVSMVEVESDTHVRVRNSENAVTLPDAVSWVEVDLKKTDGTNADEYSA